MASQPRKPRLGQYLEWHRGSIRVTIPVPKALQSTIGTTRLKRSLRTDSPANAERIKHAVIHELKAIIARAEKPTEKLVGEAMEWRETLDAAKSGKEREALEWLMHDRAEELETGNGHTAAQEFAAIASGQATPIGTLLDSYLQSCGLKPRTQDGIRRTVRVYEDWAGANGEPTAVERITRKVAGRFVSDHLLPRMEPQSAGTYTKFLSGYWKFLDGKGYAEGNPWTGQLQGVKQARKRQSILLDTGANDAGGKRPYTDDEARTLLYAEPVSATDRRTLDIVRIGALTGMRIEEICSLRVRDCEGGWFNVNAEGKGKTDAARRRVPIHPLLRSLVDRRYADKKPDGYLFHDLPKPPQDSIRERSMPASKAYTRFRRRLGVDERVEGQRQSNVDFHSWRRWFIRKAKDAAQEPWTIADVVGHDTSDLPLGLTMGRYPGRANDKALKECVESVQLPEASA
jgi:integrase